MVKAYPEFIKTYPKYDVFIEHAKSAPIEVENNLNYFTNTDDYPDDGSFVAKLLQNPLKENALAKLQDNYKGDFATLLANRDRLDNAKDSQGNPISSTQRSNIQRLLNAYDVINKSVNSDDLVGAASADPDNVYLSRAVNLSQYRDELDSGTSGGLDMLLPEFSRRRREGEGAGSKALGAVKDVLRAPARLVRPLVQSITPLGNDGLSYAESVGMPDKYKSGSQEMFDEVAGFTGLGSPIAKKMISSAVQLPFMGGTLAKAAEKVTGAKPVQQAIARATDLAPKNAAFRSILSNTPEVALDVGYEMTKPDDEEGSPFISALGGLGGSALGGFIGSKAGKYSGEDVGRFATDLDIYRAANPEVSQSTYGGDLIDALRGKKSVKDAGGNITTDGQGIEGLKEILGSERERFTKNITNTLNPEKLLESTRFSTLEEITDPINLKPTFIMSLGNTFDVREIEALGKLLNNNKHRVSSQALPAIESFTKAFDSPVIKNLTDTQSKNILSRATMNVPIESYTGFRTSVRELKEKYGGGTDERLLMEKLERLLKKTIDLEPEVGSWITKYNPTADIKEVNNLSKEYKTAAKNKMPDLSGDLGKIKDSYEKFAKLYNLEEDLPDNITSLNLAKKVDAYLANVGSSRLNRNEKTNAMNYMFDVIDDLKNLTGKGGILSGSGLDVNKITGKMVTDWEQVVLSSLARKLKTKSFWSEYYNNGNSALAQKVTDLVKNVVGDGLITKGKLRSIMQQADLLLPSEIGGKDKSFSRSSLLPMISTPSDATRTSNINQQ